MVYFSSDFHLGHKVITKYRPQFSTRQEHDEAILSLVSKLTKRDDLYILGDFIFDCPEFEDYLKAFSKMPVKIKLVMGNHDSRKLYSQEIAKNIEVQLPLFSYKNMWVSHCPIIEQELRSRDLNIHGHLHGSTINSDRYFNVNLDNNSFKLVSLDEIKERQQLVIDSFKDSYAQLSCDDICS